MMYVNVNYHTSPGKVGAGVRYIAHREEGLPQGETRTLYGIGPRYRELRGDETAIVRLLRTDAAGLKQPHFYRAKLTVDDTAAARLMALPVQSREWAIRQAVDKTFEGAFRPAQGAFVIHYHGGAKRPFGHPHVHVVLSPRLQDGAALRHIPKPQLQRFKDRWEREILRATGAYARRASRLREQMVPTPAPRLPGGGSLGERLVAIAARRTIAAALGRPAGAVLRTLGDARAVRGGFAESFRRLAPRLAEAVAPSPLRTALRMGRLWSRLSGGRRDGNE